MSFGLFLLGFMIVVGGVAWGLIKAGAPTSWVIIGCVILAGVGILTAVMQTRSKDRPNP